MPSVCPGCGASFSYAGMTNHLSQTQNPPCKAIYQAQFSYDPPTPNPSPSPEPSHFAGDFFGDDYGPDDFTWDETWDGSVDLDVPASDDECDSQADDDDFLEPAWEQPLDPTVASNSEEDDDGSDMETDLSTPVDHCQRSAHASVRGPLYIDKFAAEYPRAQAGSRVGVDMDSNSRYGAALLDQMATWAPFKSRIDWEVARWAKLRGPSSTAFSELLSIDGVSLKCPLGCFSSHILL